MAGSKQYRYGVTAGMNWRRALVNFDQRTQGMVKSLARRAGKNPEWQKGFRIGYAYERREK